MATRPREARIERHERCAESFGESDVCRIVSCEVIPQLPDAPYEGRMRVPVDRKIQKPVQRVLRSPARNLSTADVPTENLRHFQVNQVRRMERYVGVENSVGDAL